MSETLRFSDVLTGQRKVALGKNWLRKLIFSLENMYINFYVKKSIKEAGIKKTLENREIITIIFQTCFVNLIFYHNPDNF